MAAVRQLLQARAPNGRESRAAAMSDIDALMRKVFEKPAPDPAQAQAADQPLRDLDAAFDLLDRAAGAVEVLASRCQRFEAQMLESAEQAKVEAATQERAVAQWKKLASGMKVHSEETEKQLAAMKARCEAAEARAAAAEQRAAALQAASEAAVFQAAAAEDLSTEFHDKVVASFGIGSRAYVALEAVSTKAIANQEAQAA